MKPMMKTTCAAAILAGVTGLAGAQEHERFAPTCETPHVAAYMERYGFTCETTPAGFAFWKDPETGATTDGNPGPV